MGIMQLRTLVNTHFMSEFDIENFDSKKFLKEFGLNLAEIRKSKGYSQDRLCLEAGFARGTLSKIESGKVDPQLTTLVRIAGTLGVPLKKIIEVG